MLMRGWKWRGRWSATIRAFASTFARSRAGNKMSGIGTIFNLDRTPVDVDQLQRLTASLSPRGPDGTTSYCSQHFAACFSALHTTKESWLEKQPLVAPNGDVLVMDGILLNREE